MPANEPPYDDVMNFLNSSPDIRPARCARMSIETGRCAFVKIRPRSRVVTGTTHLISEEHQFLSHPGRFHLPILGPLVGRLRRGAGG